MEQVYSYKAFEIVSSASITINICVLFYVGLPWIINLSKRDQDMTSNLRSNVPAFINRISSSLPFYVAFPICSIVLAFTSNVLENPFFVFDRPLRIVFSIAIGQYMYKIAESIYWKKDINYKPTVIHHSVVISIYAVIIYYEQCAVIGLVGLLLKGSFVFSEFDYEKLSRVLKKKNSSRTLLITSSLLFVSAVIFKGLVPGFFILFSVTKSSNELLKVQYVPLAFFFLSLVFFSALSGWFIKDAFYGLKDMMHCERNKLLLTSQNPTTVINHQGLVQLIEGSKGVAIVRCNDLWDKDLNSLCSANALQSKVQNSDVIDIECETPAVVKTTNILMSQDP